MELRGKRILITGGGSGIGLALGRRLAEENTVMIATVRKRSWSARGRRHPLCARYVST
jgi:short-subunit dehydrogenase involved in D-alanine esterification of teichoic acids